MIISAVREIGIIGGKNVRMARRAPRLALPVPGTQTRSCPSSSQTTSQTQPFLTIHFGQDEQMDLKNVTGQHMKLRVDARGQSNDGTPVHIQELLDLTPACGEGIRYDQVLLAYARSAGGTLYVEVIIPGTTSTLGLINMLPLYGVLLTDEEQRTLSRLLKIEPDTFLALARKNTPHNLQRRMNR